MSRGPKWSETELAIARRGVEAGMTNDEISEALGGRTLTAVAQKMSSEGMSRYSLREWSEDELDRLVEMHAHGDMTYLQMANVLGRSYGSTASKIKELVREGRISPRGKGRRPRPCLTGDQEQRCLDLHDSGMSINRIAARTGYPKPEVARVVNGVGHVKDELQTFATDILELVDMISSDDVPQSAIDGKCLKIRRWLDERQRRLDAR